MVGIILIVHGSRDPKWRQVFQSFLDVVKQQIPHTPIELAYMELSPPSLADIVLEWQKNNINTIQVLPLFMADGGHVDHDIPAQIDTIRQKHPNISINQLPPIGKHALVQTAMIQVIRSLI